MCRSFHLARIQTDGKLLELVDQEVLRQGGEDGVVVSTSEGIIGQRDQVVRIETDRVEKRANRSPSCLDQT